MPIGPLVAQASSSPLLDPPTRAVLLMSLLAFVLLGLGLMAGAMIGGRWVRRLGNGSLRKPLPLRRPTTGRPERTPAMLRGIHWEQAADTVRGDAAADTQAGPR